MKKSQQNALQKAVQVLEAGGVIIYPTETAYGLGVDATNKAAINRLYKLKGRNKNKPLSVIVSDARMAKRYAYMDKQATQYAKKFWPGPLTLILKRRSNLPKELTHTETIGLRVSTLVFARKLSQKFNKPIVATSANFSGDATAYSARRIRADWKKAKLKPDLFLDGGKLPRRKPSTILSLTSNKPKILRQGSMHPL